MSEPLEQLELFPKEDIVALRLKPTSMAYGSLPMYMTTCVNLYGRKMVQFVLPNGDEYTYRLANIRHIYPPA